MAGEAIKSKLTNLLDASGIPTQNGVNGQNTLIASGDHSQTRNNGHTNGVSKIHNFGFEEYNFPFEVHFLPLYPPDHSQDFIDAIHYDGFKQCSTVLEKGHTRRPGVRPLPCDMHYDRDVPIKLRDGIIIYTDVFRPVTSKKIPAILPYSPYGKTGQGRMTYDKTGPFNCGIDPASISGYEKFEGPDPAEWANRGYATINIDARGGIDSEGDMMRWGPQESRDIYDVIEWITQQSWCSGAVTMQGNSWLGVSQINHAARDCHPALKCIAPWEGHADHYRDVMVRGGVPQVAFGNWMQKELVGRGRMEDTSRMAIEHPFLDEYWKTKVIPVEKINIPIYQTASYSSFIHTFGSIRTFRTAQTPDKWLRIHNRQEWADLYVPKNVDDLQRFYDRYCKGIENGWERDTPRVRLSLISFTGKDVVERPELEYPLSRQRLVKVYLNAENLSMSTQASLVEATNFYEGHHLTDCLDFKLQINRYTEIAGYPCLKIWVSCKEHDDLDIRVQLRKMDASGKLLWHANFPSTYGNDAGDALDVNIYKFLGPTGTLRASHRLTYNKERSSVNEPHYDHDHREPIPRGTIVPLTIGIWPSGLVFDKGETLVLRIAGHSLVLPEFKIMKPTSPTDLNVGKHNIHTGGQYDSHLLLPIIS